MAKKINKEKKCKKLNYEIVRKIKKIIDDAKNYMENKDIERLELSFIGQFPELSFDEETFNLERLPH
jgi:predicted secreted Zn-dependent protease